MRLLGHVPADLFVDGLTGAWLLFTYNTTDACDTDVGATATPCTRLRRLVFYSYSQLSLFTAYARYCVPGTLSRLGCDWRFRLV